METREKKHPFIYVLIAAALIWVGIICLFVEKASAQTGGYVFSPRESGQPHGRYIIAWNATGTAIPAGTVVMADTLGSGTVPQVAVGKAFRTWSGDVADFHKVYGILIEPAVGKAQAKIMVEGFLPNVKVMSGISAGAVLRPSLTAAGRLAAWTANDSTNQYRRKACGLFERYAATDTSVAYVWFSFPPR